MLNDQKLKNRSHIREAGWYPKIIPHWYPHDMVFEDVYPHDMVKKDVLNPKKSFIFYFHILVPLFC